MTTKTNKEKQRLAQIGSAISISTYFVLAVTKLIAAYYLHSNTLKADGLNNFSDIISSLIVFVGLWFAKKPADEDHGFGHGNYEIISSYTVSLIMFVIGFEVVIDSVRTWMSGQVIPPDTQTIWIAVITFTIFLGIYFYIRRLSQVSESLGLKATAQDMLNDLLMTLTPILGVLGNFLGFPKADIFLAIAIGILIIYSAIHIFLESVFALSEGYQPELLEKYRQSVLEHPEVNHVRSIRARKNGQNSFVDISVEVDASHTLEEAHAISDDIAKMLKDKYDVYDTTIHFDTININH